MNKVSVLVILGVSALTLISVGAYSLSGILTNTPATNSGITNLEIKPMITGSGANSTIDLRFFSDSGCVNRLNSITWGSLEPGSVKQCLIYIKNFGSSNVTTISSISNWDSASSEKYLSLTWDGADTVISPGSVAATTLKLTVSPKIQDVGAFSVDVVLAAGES